MGGCFATQRWTYDEPTCGLCSFKYLTPRIRITPNDLQGTKLEKPSMLHFICSPSRAAEILDEVQQIDRWDPVTIYEPIPVRTKHRFLANCRQSDLRTQDRCIPEELPALKRVLDQVSVLR